MDSKFVLPLITSGISAILSITAMVISIKNRREDRWDKRIRDLDDMAIGLQDFLASQKNFPDDIPEADKVRYANSLVRSQYYRLISHLDNLLEDYPSEKKRKIIFSLAVLDITNSLEGLIHFPQYEKTHRVIAERFF